MKRLSPPIIALVGPTAAGKTASTFAIADHYPCEIVGMDSMQVYRYMDIGTAKPTREEQSRIPHHLVDIVDPDDEYTAGRFVRDAEKAITAIQQRGNIPLLAGGTGLYLQSLLNGLCELSDLEGATETDVSLLDFRTQLKSILAEEGGREKLFKELQDADPVSATRIHPNDTQRLLRGLEIFHATGMPWSEHIARQQQTETAARHDVLLLGLACDRDILYERINSRTEQMWKMGLPEEVGRLLDMGYGNDLKSMQSIGYRHAGNYLAGEWSREKAVEFMARDTRHYAKRQFTWFQRDKSIIWMDAGDGARIIELIDTYLAERGIQC